MKNCILLRCRLRFCAFGCVRACARAMSTRVRKPCARARDYGSGANRARIQTLKSVIRVFRPVFVVFENRRQPKSCSSQNSASDKWLKSLNIRSSIFDLPRAVSRREVVSAEQTRLIRHQEGLGYTMVPAAFQTEMYLEKKEEEENS